MVDIWLPKCEQKVTAHFIYLCLNHSSLVTHANMTYALLAWPVNNSHDVTFIFDIPLLLWTRLTLWDFSRVAETRFFSSIQHITILLRAFVITSYPGTQCTSLKSLNISRAETRFLQYCGCSRLGHYTTRGLVYGYTITRLRAHGYLCIPSHRSPLFVMTIRLQATFSLLDWIKHITTGLFNIKVVFSTSKFYREVPRLATYCPWDVLHRWLAICLLYFTEHFRTLVLTKSCSVSLT